MFVDESVSFFFRSSVLANWDDLSREWEWSDATEAGLAVLVDFDHLEEILDGWSFLFFLHYLINSCNQSFSIHLSPSPVLREPQAREFPIACNHFPQSSFF